MLEVMGVGKTRSPPVGGVTLFLKLLAENGFDLFRYRHAGEKMHSRWPTATNLTSSGSHFVPRAPFNHERLDQGLPVAKTASPRVCTLAPIELALGMMTTWGGVAG